jgi:hypothetical protein
MKGTLVFTLPEEREEFELAQNGWKYKAALEDLSAWLRSKYKYENKETLTIEEIREKLVELTSEQ